MNASQYSQHIKTICLTYGIQWKIISTKREKMKSFHLWSSSTSCPSATPQYIKTPIIQGKDYLQIFAVALHELGHCLDFLCMPEYYQSLDVQKTVASNDYKKISLYLLRKEFIAWDIAKSLAGPLWNSKISKLRYYTLSTWIALYNSTHKRQMSVKNFPRHFFWDTTTPSPKST